MTRYLIRIRNRRHLLKHNPQNPPFHERLSTLRIIRR
jgi:hypothetical protein